MQANRTRSQGDVVMLDGGKGFLRPFFFLAGLLKVTAGASKYW